MRYEANPKHKHPWQPGRKGSLCPKLPDGAAERLLAASTQVDSSRYATDGEQAFAAHEHASGVWHGHPVGWVEVPEPLRREWLAAGRTTRASIRRHWIIE